MKTLALLLALACSVAAAQTSSSHTNTLNEQELLAGELEEIAMCHHAIKAAHHDGLALDQNPYFRYILNSPQKGHGENVYPIPERCRNLETSLVLNYSQMSTAAKTGMDINIRDSVQMNIAEISQDAQFLTVVINKMELEGDKAVFVENMDKDIP